MCNDRITGLPADFSGIRSGGGYYTLDGKDRYNAASVPVYGGGRGRHQADLLRYAGGYTKENFTSENLKETAWESLKISEKFTPIIYHEEERSLCGKKVSACSLTGAEI